MSEKLCFRCKQAPRESHNSYCRPCWNEYQRAYQRDYRMSGQPRREPRPQMRLPEGHKWCGGCKCVKPHDEFCRDRTAKDGYKRTCKTCCALSYYRRMHRMTPAEREAYLATARARSNAYYARHRDVVTARNRGAYRRRIVRKLQQASCMVREVRR